MQFFAITTWLMEKEQLGRLEQQRALCLSIPASTTQSHHGSASA